MLSTRLHVWLNQAGKCSLLGFEKWRIKIPVLQNGGSEIRGRRGNNRSETTVIPKISGGTRPYWLNCSVKMSLLRRLMVRGGYG